MVYVQFGLELKVLAICFSSYLAKYIQNWLSVKSKIAFKIIYFFYIRKYTNFMLGKMSCTCLRVYGASRKRISYVQNFLGLYNSHSQFVTTTLILSEYINFSKYCE